MREFEQLRKLVTAAHEKAKVDERWAVYEVLTGAPDETYLFLRPMASLAEWDKDEATHGKEYQDALGEDIRGRLREFHRLAVKSLPDRDELQPEDELPSEGVHLPRPRVLEPQAGGAASQEELTLVGRL